MIPGGGGGIVNLSGFLKYSASSPDLKVSLHTHFTSLALAHIELNINIIMTNLIEPKIRKLINPVLNNYLLLT